MATKNKRKTYSPEQRAKALEALKTQTLKAVAATTGISIATLSIWTSEARKASGAATAGVIASDSEDLEMLRLENEFLRKKVALLEKKGR